MNRKTEDLMTLAELVFEPDTRSSSRVHSRDDDPALVEILLIKGQNARFTTDICIHSRLLRKSRGRP
jgi:hypothetical protein